MIFVIIFYQNIQIVMIKIMMTNYIKIKSRDFIRFVLNINSIIHPCLNILQPPPFEETLKEGKAAV